MRIIRFEVDKKQIYGEIINKLVYQWSDAPWNQGRRLSKKYNLQDLKIIAPCEPGKIIGIAVNYPGATGLTSENKRPLVFIKPSSSVIGPNEYIKQPDGVDKIWGEGELGIVIGKKLSKVNSKEAMEGIFGYTIGNDVSCENNSGWDHHLAESKCADTFCVLGPWIDTGFDPVKKTITSHHNKTLMRKGFCDERLLMEPDLLVWLSSWITLEPGDVILSGAPSRVRDRVYFKDGDLFSCEIEGLGILSNPFKTYNDKK